MVLALLGRVPVLPRAIIGAAGVVLALTLWVTIADAQESEPVSTGPLAVADTTVEPGQSVVVSGDGYAPGTQVDITIESEPIRLATVSADAAGEFTTSVVIPEGLSPGSHTIKATGADPAGGLRVLSVVVTVLGTAGAALPTTGAGYLAVVGAAGLALLATGLAFRRRHQRMV